MIVHDYASYDADLKIYTTEPMSVINPGVGHLDSAIIGTWHPISPIQEYDEFVEQLQRPTFKFAMFSATKSFLH